MMLISKMIKPLGGIMFPIAKNTHCSGSTPMVKSFENAIAALNSLQTNSAALNLSIQLRQQQKHDEANFNLRDTERFLERIDGFSMNCFDKLSVIHVSGSKGKGTVCTYTDAILRKYKVKTGLFTSPHLISVTERIKLMGLPIDKCTFNKYFWEVYDALQMKKDHVNDLPSYFKFLQVMAFYIFVKEKVDVAIVEVGIGGQFDSTNIIRKTEIVGITALQLEHSQLLGKTIEEIAWQKAGIIKEDSYVYYMNQNEYRASKVIEARFKELKGKRLSCVPQFEDYVWHNCLALTFKSTSEINKINFSLAAQLCGRWLRNRNKLPEYYYNDNLLTTIEANFAMAIENCQVEGRFQQINTGNITFYIDGAHTKDSLCITSEWFSSRTRMSEHLNILLFNVTGDRDSEQLLKPLHSIYFDLICFSTNLENDEANKTNENYSEILKNVQLDRCFKHKEIWMKICADTNSKSCHIECCPTIQNAIDYISKWSYNNSNPTNVLVTGSLHLVGGAFKVIRGIQFDNRKERINEAII